MVKEIIWDIILYREIIVQYYIMNIDDSNIMNIIRYVLYINSILAVIYVL